MIMHHDNKKKPWTLNVDFKLILIHELLIKQDFEVWRYGFYSIEHVYNYSYDKKL